MTGTNESLNLKKAHSGKLFDKIYQRYDLLNHILSFGLDLRWRKRLAKKLSSDISLFQAPEILDLAGGTGDMTIAVKKECPSSHVTCIDISANMMVLAEKKVAKRRMDNVQFKLGDAGSLPLEDSSMDAITVAFGIRNFPSLDQSVKEMRRVLKSEGKLYVLEFGWPKNPIISILYKVFSITIIPALGWLIAGDRSAYQYLHQTIRSFPYGESIVPVFNRNGFTNVKYYKMAGGIVYLYQCFTRG